jgi:N6-L-threonylcarbamoyladenine synthase
MGKSSELILAIDTSCDETAAAVSNGVKILSNIIASQAELHKKYGGVVPGLARREHEKFIDPVVDEALDKAGVKISDIDVVAVTQGPGLAIALEVGIEKAKKLAEGNSKPLIAIDHMEGHLLSSFAQDKNGKFGIQNPQFPALGLLVSGGHTELILMKNFGKYELVGQTLDDAAGECFDKVARILDLEYPGGPALSELAAKGNETAFDFPVPMKNSKNLNFSFSGLKTACLYKSQELGTMTQKQKADFAASFEKSAVEHLMNKLRKSIRKYKPKMLLIGGGVINNKNLQKEVEREAELSGIPVYIPPNNSLLTDNAAMIAVSAFFKAKRGEFVKDVNKLDRNPSLTL